LDKLADAFEGLSVESFSEIIGPLFFGVNLQDDDIAIVDRAPEEVSFDKKVLRLVGNAWWRVEGGLHYCPRRHNNHPSFLLHRDTT
jgi:hypothetical protein